MATSALRLRRKALSLSSFILNHHRAPLYSSAPAVISQSPAQNPKFDFPSFPSQIRGFRSSNVTFARPRQSFNDDDRQIGPDDILFEGCDYNHWLITIDFPKDENKPSPEEMVETYVQTAAKVLGSVEEAKRKIYACSTTTYHGFQVEVSEEVSKQFEGLPGVVFVLPDSYIDPTNKEYGGDKYINGTIIPRPPPVHYGRATGRVGDRNRDYNRPNSGRGEYQQGRQTYGNNQGSMQGSPAPQNPQAQQNYGPPGVNGRPDFVPTNNSHGGQDSHPGYRRDQRPPSQGYYNHDQRRNSSPPGQSVPPGHLTNNVPPQVGNSGQGLNYGQGAGAVSGVGAGAISEGNQRQGAVGGYGQGAGGGYGQGAGGGYGQGAGGGYGQGAGGGYGQGAGGGYGQGASGGYGQGGASGGYGQGASGGYGQGASGSYGQGASGGYSPGVGGRYSQAPGGGYSQAPGGGYSQGAGGGYSQVPYVGVPGNDKISNYGQRYPIHGENETLSQGEQMNDVQQVQQ